MPNCISLDHATVPLSMCDRLRTFINCLPSIDLELQFQGTILCEIDDLYQTPPKQLLVHLLALAKRTGPALFYISQTTFDCLKLQKLCFFRKDLFVLNS